jgi:hypothetical protein
LDLVTEARWLGRSLIILAAAVFLYWAALLARLVAPEADEAWLWTMSHSLAHLFLVVLALLAARSLLRGEPRAPILVGLVAGVLIVLALEGIARSAVGGVLDNLTLGDRTDVLLRAATLAIGVWAASYALRAEKRSPGS